MGRGGGLKEMHVSDLFLKWRNFLIQHVRGFCHVSVIL
jgi:hypothetical protein